MGEQSTNLNDLSKKIVDIESKLKPSATSQSGSLTISAPKGLTNNYTITFPETFNTVPTVIITCNNPYLGITVVTVTKGGFTIRCSHGLSAEISGTATWNATADIVG